MTHHVETLNGPVVHTGGYLHIQGAAFNPTETIQPKVGTGVELLYIRDTPEPSAWNGYGILHAYSRDTASYRDLIITGRNVTINANGGKLALPAGSVQSLKGQYVGTTGWQVPAQNVWYETPVQVDVACTAGYVYRVEACGVINFSATGLLCYLGLAYNGTGLNSLQAIQFPTGAGIMNYSMLAYFAYVPTGTMRFAVWMHSANVGGTGGFWPSAAQSLYVTEQRA